MSSTDKLIKSFLEQLNSNEVTQTFELLSTIVEILENKADPELFEVHLFNAASDMIEKVNILHGMLTEHRAGNIQGNQLQKLYDKRPTDVGSQVLFD